MEPCCSLSQKWARERTRSKLCCISKSFSSQSSSGKDLVPGQSSQPLGLFDTCPGGKICRAQQKNPSKLTPSSLGELFSGALGCSCQRCCFPKGVGWNCFPSAFTRECGTLSSRISLQEKHPDHPPDIKTHLQVIWQGRVPLLCPLE